jgi:Protein of unknown function (DUF3775)
MSYLSINKIYKIIEMAELIYGIRGHERKNQPETFIDKLSYYLEDYNITGRCTVNFLQKYIEEFSQKEKVELIALIWLGQIPQGQVPEDFTNLIKQVIEFIPQNYATNYIIEKPLLAKYLRNGLQKIDIWNSAFS